MRDLDDPHRERSTVRMIEQALRKGWLKPWDNPAGMDDLPAKAVERVLALLEEENPKDKTIQVYMEILRKMRADNLALAAQVDKTTGAEAPAETTVRVVYEGGEGSKA